MLNNVFSGRNKQSEILIAVWPVTALSEFSATIKRAFSFNLQMYHLIYVQLVYILEN